ncbi:MAG: polysaccharide biosynthesis C-terminal domain-containing protein [Treponema sp.]|nr:polysaccharide biosynthesis C-terminal domain-containing protein [Treponema sp.]
MRNLSSRFGPFSFYREAIAIALPVMAQQFIMSMVSLIDNFMVAGLGDISMAAVNVANQINFVYFIVLNTVCQAGGIYIAQFRGGGDSEGMKHAYRFKIVFAAAASAVFFILYWTIPHKMIAVMTMGNAAQEEIVALGSGYLRLISWALFPMAISFAAGSSFREIARPKVPLVISAMATLVNTAGNWILIYGNLGAPRLEVSGAAYATIIARGFEVVIFLTYSAGVKAPFFVGITRLFNVHWKLFKEILYKSGMIFVSELSWISSETIMTAMYNRRGGAEVVAGMAAGWTIANIFFLFFGGIWTAAGVLIGGSLGAGKLDEARSRAAWLKSGSVAAGLLVAIPGAIFSVPLIHLVYSNLSAAARYNCTGLVFVVLAYLPFWGLLNVQFAISRAGGDTATGMYADLSVNTLLFVPGSILISLLTTIAPVPMLALLKITDFVKLFICHHFLKKERWVKNLTVIH